VLPVPMLPPVGGGVAEESGTVEGVLGTALGDVGLLSGVAEFGLTFVPGCVVPGVGVVALGVCVVALGICEFAPGVCVVAPGVVVSVPMLPVCPPMVPLWPPAPALPAAPAPAPAPAWATAQHPHNRTVLAKRTSLRFI
jgi:hypothetical protein